MEFIQSVNTGKRTLVIFARATAMSLALLFIAVPTFGATIVVPNSLATVEGNFNNGWPFHIDDSISMRYQQVFAASGFGSPSTPVLITQISFRPDSEQGNTFATILTNIQINLSTTTAAPDGLSSTFATNVGSDDKVVFSGPLSLESADTGPVGGPMAFDIIINLQTPFLYDPSSGNLLFDVRNFDGGFTVAIDLEQFATDSVSRAYSDFTDQNGVNSTTGATDTGGLIAQFTTTPPAPPCVTPPPDMVAWYPLDELTGATEVNDIAPPPGSLFNNVGFPQPGPALGNGPIPVIGQVGGAHYFYPGHFHEVAPNPELDFGSGDFSIDAWIQAVGNTGQVQSIVDKLDTAPVTDVGFALYIESLTLKLNINGSTFVATSMITAGNPYHVAATVSRSSGVGILYLNGVPAGPAFTLPNLDPTSNALPMWIGETRLPNSVGEIAIDELEIFNRVLTPQEIVGIYAAGHSGKCKVNDIFVDGFEDM